ncbi:unnamed protein product, partial [Nesidiocoris tenuis]
RVTTTLQGGKEEQERLNRANLLYGNILKRFMSDGSFTNWDNAPPSMDCRTGRQWTFRLRKSNTRTRGHSDGRASTPAAIQKPSKRRVTVSFLCWRMTASQQQLTTSSSGSRQCECPTVASFPR